MSWRKIPMKFPGTCVVCNEKIEVNEIGLWAKGLGVKHEKCAQINELQCIVCKGSAGCLHCEFQDICDIQKVSQLCICKKCSEEKNSFDSYQKSVKKNFPLLNLNS
ncbi:MAG: hypothetical protein COW26_00535 [Nitrosopumilales archaeon CG15_BIG_FIL_POST_REV_8_21_14_020_33_23]|jgi:hypothetical protein|nr:MAG: hypothetical protein COV65_02235 [Nitrosopumilales archaeon CG11_big_fil_rev_8_21_14_0_20_33_24]PIN97008.1 MAG: hypothetical protein COU45_04915 [Nitrosopumilus sp. CG10_big_fil_rev_8_21_14_0_10_33_7]PIW36172.1 MAG: hypothetical protein COW26_00535 [Nitrosopumilales archaeon CG15_BIG_FIL_POST_REV_8_21_14_020_33_23]PIY89376.1 MAG: hypothetical protein COY74_06170 [Nitrosopumilales archaeon CG_4_10_14_0_8_um_filter_34_8]